MMVAIYAICAHAEYPTEGEVDTENAAVAENFLSLLVLALLMVWPMLIPLVVFLAMGEYGADTMKSRRTWLTRNQRMMNVVVMGIIGMLLLFLGLTGIY